MSKKFTGVLVIAVIAIIVLFAVSVYNALVKKDETVKTAWGQVENQYQRRYDLIPSLVNTVKGHAAHEKETLQGVIEARSKVSQLNIDADNLSPESIAQFQQVQGELTSALSKLMVVVERYPDLKANENFLTLQAQLEGTENRIAYERKNFNEAAKNYNTYCRKFPNTLIAGMFGFQQKDYFKSAVGADKAVEVKF